MNCRNVMSIFTKISVYHSEYMRVVSWLRVSPYCNFTRIHPRLERSPLDEIVNQSLSSRLSWLSQLGSWNAQSRGYAKGKDRKKSDKGKKNVPFDEAAMKELINVESLKHQMQNSIDTMKEEYIKHLSLRSTTGSFEVLKVKFEGTEYPLQDLAQIVRKNPKTIVVNMSAFPQAIPSVLEAIASSGMNLNPQQDGTTLYIPVPTVTKEHRENLSKNAKSLFIKCRDSIKDVQSKVLKSLKNKENVSTDAVFSAQQQITTLTNTFVSQAESIMETKQKELLGKD